MRYTTIGRRVVKVKIKSRPAQRHLRGEQSHREQQLPRTPHLLEPSQAIAVEQQRAGHRLHQV